ncbi:MAG: ABC-2 family transporter protein [Polyangiales bacterium]
MTAIALARPATTNKYTAIALVALRQRLGDRSVLIARAVFYVLVLFIFSRIWKTLGQGGDRYVWYLAVTEWVTLSQPRLFLEIERDVRSGEIAYQLTRPTSYLVMQLAEGAGELVLGLSVLGLVGLCAATLLTSSLPDPTGLLFAGALGLTAAVLLLLCNALIGLSAFWLQDCSPLYWLWQKANFVLGGLFLPLALYPSWLRLIALWLPFSAIVGGPGSMLLEPDAKVFVLLAIKLSACIVLAWQALDALYERAVQRLELNGG